MKHMYEYQLKKHHILDLTITCKVKIASDEDITFDKIEFKEVKTDTGEKILPTCLSDLERRSVIQALYQTNTPLKTFTRNK